MRCLRETRRPVLMATNMNAADRRRPAGGARPGSLSARAAVVGTVAPTTKRVSNASAPPAGTTPAGTAAKRSVMGPGGSTTAAPAGKENATRTRPASARPAARVSNQRAPLQVGEYPRHYFRFAPVRNRNTAGQNTTARKVRC